jgi:hypothetical protein
VVLPVNILAVHMWAEAENEWFEILAVPANPGENDRNGGEK